MDVGSRWGLGDTGLLTARHLSRHPAWSIQTVLQPWVVRRGIYGGVRRGR